MQFTNIIETPRLILKGIDHDCMKYIFGHIEKTEIMSILGHRSEEDYLKEENKHINGYSSYNRRFILFLLTDKPTGHIIGRCGIHNWNADHKRAEIGYVMEDENSKQKGLMTEAVDAILNFGFEHLHLNRIEAVVGVWNHPSLNLMKKFNFVKEGQLRMHHHSDGEFGDSFMFSKLRHEYMAEKTNK